MCSDAEEATVAGIMTLGIFVIMERLFPGKTGLQVFATGVSNYLIIKKLTKRPLSVYNPTLEIPDYNSKCTGLSHMDLEDCLLGFSSQDAFPADVLILNN